MSLNISLALKPEFDCDSHPEFLAPARTADRAAPRSSERSAARTADRTSQW